MTLVALASDLSPLLVCAVVVAIALIGGLLPASPLEPVLIAIAALGSPTLTMQVVIVAAIAQMVPKTMLFLGSARAVEAMSPRKRVIVDRVGSRLAGRRWAQIVTVFVSAVVGMPPFYLMTVICGGLRLRLSDYFVAGAVGRTLRYVGLAMLPGLVAG